MGLARGNPYQPVCPLCSNLWPAVGQHPESPGVPYVRGQRERHHWAAVAGGHQRLPAPSQAALFQVWRSPDWFLLDSDCSSLLWRQVRVQAKKKAKCNTSTEDQTHFFTFTEIKLEDWKWFWAELFAKWIPAVSRSLVLRSTGYMRSLTQKHLTMTSVSQHYFKMLATKPCFP